MARRNAISFFIPAMLLLGFVAPASAEAAWTDAVIVSLHKTAYVNGPVVRVADVAKLRGGDDSVRRVIGQLDLDDAPPAGARVTVSAKYIRLRIQIAGIADDHFQVDGMQTLVVSRESLPDSAASTDSQTHSVPHDRVIAAAKECVLDRLPWDAENVEVRLFRPLEDEYNPPDTADELSFSAELRTPWPPVGRVNVNVSVWADGKSQAEIPVQLEVRHFENVVVSAKRIEKGELLKTGDLYVDRRDVSGLQDYFSDAAVLIGKPLTRTMLPLQVVRSTDIVKEQDTHNAILIKPRDRVKVVARTGGLDISIEAEALQQGRRGELIRLRNVQSQKTVIARVVDRNRAVLDF